MPFITRAREFLVDQGGLAANRNRNVMVETVRYLLDNAIGLENAVSTNTIIEYLNTQGYEITREDWEINVLGALRQNGIFIGSLRGRRGMFIIGSQDEARTVYNSYNRRIQVETARLTILQRLIDEAGWTLN